MMSNFVPFTIPATAAQQLHTRYDAHARTLWCSMHPSRRPCFTPALLAECRDLQRTLVQQHASDPEQSPVDYLILASDIPGVFNLGGDLMLFQRLIQARERRELLQYARACIDVCYHQAINLNLPLTTIALVQGDALGGGFEAALSCSVLVAERDAQLGLPEVLFNLFPGMGAFSFLARRLGPVQAERLILSGKIYTGEELYELGAVDVLAEPGGGHDAVHELIAQRRRRSSAHLAMQRVRQQYQALDYQELIRITEIWVDTAMQLSERDLKTMERLVRAQDRRRAQYSPVLEKAVG